MLVSRRLTILSPEEIEGLYSLPHFTEDDRHLYFDLSVSECEAVATVAIYNGSFFFKRFIFSTLESVFHP